MSTLIQTTFIAGGTKSLGERNAAKIWDGDATSWFQHDGWEPTNRSHKWSVAQLEYSATLKHFMITPRGNAIEELNGYTFYGTNDIGQLKSGSVDNVDLSVWTKLTMIHGITGKTRNIQGPYEVETGRSNVHYGESIIIPISNENAFQYVMIHAPGDATEKGNGDVLAVEVYGTQTIPSTDTDGSGVEKSSSVQPTLASEPIETIFMEMNELMHNKVKDCCVQLTDTIQIQQDAQKRKCIEELNNIQHKIDKGMLHFESVFQNEYTTLQTFILTKRQEHNEHTKRVQDEFEQDLQTKMTQATSTMKKRIETFQKLLNE